MCERTGKTMYPSRLEASLAKRGVLSKKGKRPTQHSWGVYRCVVCTKWHLGKKAKNNA